jgi:hypothetical protein
MPITRTAMIDDDGSGTTGTIFNNAWKQEFYNQIDANPGLVAYTPTWGATGSQPTIGNGTLNGSYARLGKVVFVNFVLTIGSTTFVGGGAWIFGLPPLGAPDPFTLSAEVFDSAVGSYVGTVSQFGATTALFYAAGAPNGIGPLAPFTFKAGDRLRAGGVLFYSGL